MAVALENGTASTSAVLAAAEANLARVFETHAAENRGRDAGLASLVAEGTSAAAAAIANAAASLSTRFRPTRPLLQNANGHW